MEAYKVPNEVEYDGIKLAGDIMKPESIELIPQIKAHPNDVLLVGYPRSGTTWMGITLDLVQSNGNIERANSSIYSSRIYYLENLEGVDRVEPNTKPRILFPAESKEPFRQLKSHLHFWHLKSMILDQNIKTILVLRNPKDMLVSYYHLYRSMGYLGNFSGGWDDFFQLFQNKQLVYGDWLEHVNSYWKNKDLENILVIKYEEALENTKGTIQNIAHFIGKELSNEKVDSIADFVNFHQMQSNPMTNCQDLVDIGKLDKDIPFIRQGKVGGWKSFFTEKQNSYIHEKYIKPMQDQGLLFRYNYD